MNVIVCVDKKQGMMFGGRRQSQDRVLREHLIALVGDGVLRMNAYSAKQFEDASRLSVDEDFLTKAEQGDFCFVENETIDEGRLEKLYIYKWNRTYPADFYFDLDKKKAGLKMVYKEEFEGFSHEKITLEVWEK